MRRSDGAGRSDRGRARRQWPGAVALGLLALAVGGAACRSERTGRPNVVLVVVDALRRDHVGAYGYPQPTTPFVDALAARGQVFENALTQSPQTMIATATILTSRLFPEFVPARRTAPAGEVGAIFREIENLAPGNLTVAEVLLDHGYETIAVFTNPHHHSESGFAQGFRLWRFLPQAPPQTHYGRAEDVAAAFAELASRREPERPIFAYLHFMDTHNPYSPPERWARRFVTAHGADRYTNGIPAEGAMPSAEDLRFMVQRYDAGLRYVDEQLAAIAAGIEAISPGRPTVFVFTADHGEEFLEHGGLGHGHSMEPELLRVPLVVSGGLVGRGRPGRMARSLDIAPTLVALAGVSPPASFEGRDLLAADGAGPPAEEVSFARFGALRSVTTAGCTLADGARDRNRFFREGPGEEIAGNRLDGAASPCLDRARGLLAKFDDSLRRERRRVRAARTAATPAPVSREVEDQLRALGYVDGR